MPIIKSCVALPLRYLSARTGKQIIGPLRDAARASEPFGHDAGIGEIERLAGRGDPRLREDKPA